MAKLTQAQLDSVPDAPAFVEEQRAFDAMRIGSIAGGAVVQIRERLDIAGSCDSPIETQFGARLASKLRAEYPGFAVVTETHAEFDDRRLLLVPQFRWARYRFDFAVKWSSHDNPLILVECDGREFHSSPEQVANDAAKDTFARASAVTLLRFAGSDIHRQSDACAVFAVAAVRAAIQRGAA